MRIVNLPQLFRVLVCSAPSPFLPALAAGALLAFPCAAEPIVFQADIDGTVHVASVDEMEFGGIGYVSIVSLTEQLGGSATILPTRARLEVAGSTAWIQADDHRVNAFRIFSLSRPVVRTEDDYLIALGDVLTFFENAFRVNLGREATPPASEPIAMETAPEPPPEAAEQPPAETTEPRPQAMVNVIVIDPGHGGFENGIEGSGGLTEKALVLDIATRLKTVLESRVHQRIVLTREEDLALNEAQRAAIVQNADADVLLTLHAGSSLSPAVRGSVVLYEAGNSRVHGRLTSDREEARRLGRLISEALRGASSIPLRGFDTAETRSMAHPGISGVMVEIGCLTNAEDEAALNDDATRAAIVDALAAGILEFLGAGDREPAEAAG